MKMTRMEKRFVNRKKKSDRNIQKLELAFEYIDKEPIKIVLELGCGIGFVSHYLAQTYNWQVFGTDYDAEQIQIANKLQPKIDHLSFQVEDAAQLSFDNSTVDLVVSQNVFHHIPNWQNAIKEIARVLSPGGYFVWLDLSFPQIVKKIFLPFVKNYGVYTIDDIKKSFDINNFKNLFHERITHGPMTQHHFVLQHI
jgi:SAM-dependent methyltransferase